MVKKGGGSLVERRPYRSWVEISLTQIAQNFRAIQEVVGQDADVMPVVKADAYRHGAIEVSQTLEAQGAQWLAVSNTDEGVALRDAGSKARILVMADFLPYSREAMLQRDLTPVIHSLGDVAEFDRLAEAQRRTSAPYHLKIDTGMGRLGVREDAASMVEAVRSARHVQLEGLMTHFASAGNFESEQTRKQVERFQAMAAALRESGIRPRFLHAASSIPVAYGQRMAWGAGAADAQSRLLVRPGHAIYGYVSPPARGREEKRVVEVTPALSWRASVLAIKEVAAGSLIGYGGMFRAARAMRIAVLAAGYADGIPHRLSNRGSVIVQGRLAPILGAVSMDLTTIDASAAGGLQVGDAVTLLGREGQVSIDAQQMARLAGTISYSVLCGIHARVKRVYLR